MTQLYSPITFQLLLALVWIAAFFDLRTRRIPNLLVCLTLAMGFVMQVGFRGFDGFIAASTGLLVGTVVLLPGYVVGTTGAGDVKLMGAIGSFLGASGAFFAAVACIAVGGLIAFVFMVTTLLSPGLAPPWRRYGAMAKTLVMTGKPVYLPPERGEVMGRRFPFAVSMALGTTVFCWLAVAN